MLARRSGDLLFFMREIPFRLPGGVRYYVDFVEFWKDGSVVFTEVKGMETDTWKIKKRLVESLFPIKIQVIK